MTNQEQIEKDAAELEKLRAAAAASATK